MEWYDIKKFIYYKDGSLRDICILNTSIDDWQKWVDFVNQKFIVEFYDKRNLKKVSKIDFNKVVEYWGKNNEEGIYARININNTKIMCYFNCNDVIENDFYPSDINTIEYHNNLMKYLVEVSKILNKPIRVTREMNQNEILIDIFCEKITYYKW